MCPCNHPFNIDNIELSKTEVSFPLLSPVPSLNRRVSTTTIRTNETLRSYGTESTMPTTMSNILSEKPNGMYQCMKASLYIIYSVYN